jgi:hypothetical protein
MSLVVSRHVGNIGPRPLWIVRGVGEFFGW